MPGSATLKSQLPPPRLDALEGDGIGGAKALGDLFWKIGDIKIIDGLGPNGVAWLSQRVGRRLSIWQSGYVYHYAFVMLLGVAALLAFAFSLAS